MTGLRVIAGPAACAGFALAGLQTAEARTARDGAALLAALAASPDLGVLLVEEPIIAALPEEERRELLRRSAPVIVPFPAPSWDEHAPTPESYVLELLRRAIGYRVRLR
jgi:vacuolar-type H+-ATPase subunit F/Vma7